MNTDQEQTRDLVNQILTLSDESYKRGYDAGHRHGREVGRKETINVELDRLAGPLVKLIEDLAPDFHDYPAVMESCDNVLATYRKERGQ